jgi:hypothetical protein
VDGESGGGALIGLSQNSWHPNADTDWLFKDQIRASRVLPSNTLGIQLGYRF